jgi:rhamnose utilization protein RhaD (predicted bifunctional aldolase and dehydrogenase)
VASAAEVAPIIRGACAVKPAGADAEPKRFVLDFRTSPEILNFVGASDLADISQRGVVTPDHVIRTKNKPLVVPAPAAAKLDDFKSAVAKAVADYMADYDAMFAARERPRRRH